MIHILFKSVWSIIFYKLSPIGVVAVNGTFVNEENLRTMGDVKQAIEDNYYSRNSMDITVLVEQFWIEFMEYQQQLPTTTKRRKKAISK